MKWISTNSWNLLPCLSCVEHTEQKPYDREGVIIMSGMEIQGRGKGAREDEGKENQEEEKVEENEKEKQDEEDRGTKGKMM